MEISILNLIDDGIKSNNDEVIAKISSKIGFDVAQTKLFLKYFNKFNILESFLDSEYVNYFNEICLCDLREKDEIKDEVFAKAIIIYIIEKRKNKKLYFMNLETENDIKLQILILSQLDYKSLKYDIKYNKELNFKNNLNFFNYIPNIIDEYAFESFSKEIIENKIDVPLINHINLNNIPYEKVFEYSKLYQNRIKKLEWYGTEEYDKLKELMELNKESLEIYPHGKIEYLIPLKNAYIFNLSELEGELNDNFNLSKITHVEGITINFEDEDLSISNIKKILNKCINLEYIFFDDISAEYFFNILEDINCPKVKEISATCENIEPDYDWSKIFDKMPLLEKLPIEEHQTMSWTYEIKPVFLAENKRLAYPLLEQLIRNYLNGSPDRDISMQFDAEFDEFWDYFKDKKDILSRLSKLSGDCIHDFPDTYFKVKINKSENIKNLKNGRYLYCIVECDFDDVVLEFVKKSKPMFLFVKCGNVNLDEMKKIEEMKFLFINSTKDCYFSNGEKVLEKI
jgi:hypothetical protein